MPFFLSSETRVEICNLKSSVKKLFFQVEAFSVNFLPLLTSSGSFLICSSQPSRIVWIRVELPVSGQNLLPDDFPQDLDVNTEQLGDGGVRVEEAVQQNLRHLSLLLPYYQPERIRKFAMQSLVLKRA